MKCPMHDLIQEETKEHRDLVCKKIAGKADVGQVKNILYIVSALITICCLVVAGQAVWLKSDMKDIRVEAIEAVKRTDAKIESGFGTLHRRITEGSEIRAKNDEEQTQKLNDIKSTMSVVEYRLTQIEADKQKKK
jgi:hypothetical protein